MLRKFFHHWLDSFRGLDRDIWLLAFVNFINRIGSMVVIFLTIYLTEKRGFTIEESGYILVCNGVGAVIGTWLGGWLTDRFGYYKLQIIALHIQGAILFLLPHIHAGVALGVTVLCMALASETIRPANQVAFMAHSTPEMRTRSISLNRMGINISFTLAPAIGGILTVWSWDAIFYVDAITCIAAAWLMVFYLKEKQVEKPAENEETGPGISAYKDVPYLRFIFLTFINAVVFMQIMWTIPYFFAEAYGWSKPFIGIVMAINGAIVALVEMPLIFRIEKRYPALGLVRTGIICYALAHLSLALGLPVWLAAGLYIVIISFGEIYVMPFSFTYASNMSNPSRRGEYMALYTLAYAVSHIIGPLFGTQMIHRFGFDALWFSLAVLAAVSFVGTQRLERRDDARLAAEGV